MKVSNDIRILAGFYTRVAAMIKKSRTGYITLTEAETITKKHVNLVFSWMQWNDAKNWFSSGLCEDGICYYLRRELTDTPINEIMKDINTHYKLYSNE